MNSIRWNQGELAAGMASGMPFLAQGDYWGSVPSHLTPSGKGRVA